MITCTNKSYFVCVCINKCIVIINTGFNSKSWPVSALLASDPTQRRHLPSSWESPRFSSPALQMLGLRQHSPWHSSLRTSTHEPLQTQHIHPSSLLSSQSYLSYLLQSSSHNPELYYTCPLHASIYQQEIQTFPSVSRPTQIQYLVLLYSMLHMYIYVCMSYPEVLFRIM